MFVLFISILYYQAIVFSHASCNHNHCQLRMINIDKKLIKTVLITWHKEIFICWKIYANFRRFQPTWVDFPCKHFAMLLIGRSNGNQMWNGQSSLLEQWCTPLQWMRNGTHLHGMVPYTQTHTENIPFDRHIFHHCPLAQKRWNSPAYLNQQGTNCFITDKSCDSSASLIFAMYCSLHFLQTRTLLLKRMCLTWPSTLGPSIPQLTVYCAWSWSSAGSLSRNVTPTSACFTVAQRNSSSTRHTCRY